MPKTKEAGLAARKPLKRISKRSLRLHLDALYEEASTWIGSKDPDTYEWWAKRLDLARDHLLAAINELDRPKD